MNPLRTSGPTRDTTHRIATLNAPSHPFRNRPPTARQPRPPRHQQSGGKRMSAADTSAMEREIDQQVYVLYGLTPEEIAIVEGTAK